MEHILSHPKILTAYFKRPGQLKYQFILVDEAQDLSGRWLKLMNSMLNKKQNSCSIWVFSDPYQMVRRGTEMPDETELEGFETLVLTRVLRNTREVFEAYQYCFNSQDNSIRRTNLGKPVVEHDVYGSSPEYIKVESDQEFDQAVLHKINELYSKKVSLLDIAVLTQGNARSNDFSSREKLKEFLTSNKIPCQDCVEGTKKRHYKRKRKGPSVTIDTLQRFKGLEAKVLMFCIVGDWSPRDCDLYVGFSRSFCHLIVIGKGRTIEEINEKQKFQIEI